MVAEIFKTNSVSYTNEEIISYLNSCDLMSINDYKYTKSIYFKDNKDILSSIIFSLNYRTATILTTIENQKIDTTISSDEFYKIYNKYKIFNLK